MKFLTGLLFFLSSLAVSAQDVTDLTFALDTLSVDSFFLIETTTFQAANAQRPTVFERPIYFSDTTAFNLYILSKAQRLTDLENQKAQIGVEYNEVTAQLTELENLRDSVFRGATGFGFLRQLQPMNSTPSTFSKSSPTSPTSWFIYNDPKGSEFGTWFVPYNPDLPKKFDGYILKPDGTFEQVKKKRPKDR